MTRPAAELARALAEQAETVCRRYLSNGRRSGHYWIVGDVQNNRGQSLYVPLRGPGSGRGAAGRWTDAATGEHGDLLDLIRLSGGFDTFRDALDEARSFLRLPRSEPQPGRHEVAAREPARRNSPEAARRLFARARSITGTLAETYLRGRGLTVPLDDLWSLRFHPACYYREADEDEAQRWPALLAAITNVDGTITAVHRIWLDRDGRRKAPVGDPRRSLGRQLGGGVRLGLIGHVLAVGEGIETMLSLRSALPRMPVLAGLSANHLAALELPDGVRRLYVVRDNDSAGRRAETRLRVRLQGRDVEVRSLSPAYADLNADLQRLGRERLGMRVVRQLAPEDRMQFAPETDEAERAAA
ncbi:toprim domain-containing protein [uncultured Enterovirga sp.]|uniref:DUF7146 domain-containing protein n=1 Tax=uncultured Enterovirga sp. TaxID=2026352 RepID=UPI0035CC9A02